MLNIFLIYNIANLTLIDDACEPSVQCAAVITHLFVRYNVNFFKLKDRIKEVKF